jgi:hypothetical protein
MNYFEFGGVSSGYAHTLDAGIGFCRDAEIATSAPFRIGQRLFKQEYKTNFSEDVLRELDI